MLGGVVKVLLQGCLMAELQGACFVVMKSCCRLFQAFRSILDTHRLMSVQGSIRKELTLYLLVGYGVGTREAQKTVR